MTWWPIEGACDEQTMAKWSLSPLLILSTISSGESCAAGIYDPVTLRPREIELIETSRELHTRFERRSLLYGDARLLALVRGVAAELVPEPTDDYIDYQFYLLRDPSPNIFGLPNGQIYIHTGMLARLTDTSQLAAVLAHEIAHVAGHHGIINYRSVHGQNTASTILLGTSVVGRDAWHMWNDLIGVGLHSSLYGFSDAMEQEADEKAVELMLASSHDPHALPEVLETLSQDLEGLRPRLPTVWTDEARMRGRALNSWAGTVRLPPRDRDTEAFEQTIRKLRVATIYDYIEDDYPYTAVAFSQAMLERYPADAEVQQLLGDAWQAMGPRPELVPEDLTNAERRRQALDRVRKTRQQREEEMLAAPRAQAALVSNLGYARQAYERALQIDEDFAPAYRGLGEVHEQLGAPREAGKAYLHYLKHAPDAPDREIIIERLKVLRDQLRGQESGNG